MFKKNLVFGVSLVALLLLNSPAYSNEVWGWHGPVDSGDTGLVELSNEHTQGEHSLKFVVSCVDSQGGYFRKDFGGIPHPDSITWDYMLDSLSSDEHGCIIPGFWGNDTVFRWPMAYGGYMGEWNTGFMRTGWPSCVDSLEFQIGHSDEFPYHYIFHIDNIVAYYPDTTILLDGMGDGQGIAENMNPSPNFQIELLQNLPNPFGRETEIRFVVKERMNVSLVIYDLTGRKVTTLTEETREPGNHAVSWNGRDDNNKELPGGIYFCQLRSEKEVRTEKMILMR